MAACFALVAVVAFLVLPNYLKRQDTIVPDSQKAIMGDTSTEEQNDDTTSSTSETHISMSQIVINQAEAIECIDYVRYNSETDSEVVWNKEEMADYYGMDLTPVYVPDGLIASDENDHATVYIRPVSTSQPSYIEGTAVTFGYYAKPYAPYNENHEPAGYYDVYVVNFEYHGIAYEIFAEQMDVEEVVKVVASIICGEEVTVDK